MKAIATRPPTEDMNDDPPVRCAQGRQQRLRDGDLAEHVDVELLAQVVGVISSSGPPKPMPALLTSASSRPGEDSPPPPSSLTRAAACAICSRVGHVEHQRLHAPGGRFARRAARRPSSSRTPASTVQPALASRSAVAWPIPVEAPVISAVGIGESYLTAGLATA